MCRPEHSLRVQTLCRRHQKHGIETTLSLKRLQLHHVSVHHDARRIVPITTTMMCRYHRLRSAVNDDHCKNQMKFHHPAKEQSTMVAHRLDPNAVTRAIAMIFHRRYPPNRVFGPMSIHFKNCCGTKQHSVYGYWGTIGPTLSRKKLIGGMIYIPIGYRHCRMGLVNHSYKVVVIAYDDSVVHHHHHRIRSVETNEQNPSHHVQSNNMLNRSKSAASNLSRYRTWLYFCFLFGTFFVSHPFF